MIKRITIVLMLLLMMIGGLVVVGIPTETELSQDSFLRIHIRANSNTQEDQRVKYQVKEAVVNYLTPKLIDATSKTNAISIVNANLANLSEVASLVLHNAGYNYDARAVLRQESFPTRCYDDVVLASGVYDSLILELGAGLGDNWWCVVYPPLCFVGDNTSTNIVYKSKLLEIIKKVLGS